MNHLNNAPSGKRLRSYPASSPLSPGLATRNFFGGELFRACGQGMPCPYRTNFEKSVRCVLEKCHASDGVRG